MVSQKRILVVSIENPSQLNNRCLDKTQHAPNTQRLQGVCWRLWRHKKLQKGNDKRTESNERRRKISAHADKPISRCVSVYTRAPTPTKNTLPTHSLTHYHQQQQQQQMTGVAADAMDAWNPAAVIASANELIHASNYEKVGEARKSVDDTIAQWVQTVLQLQQQQQQADQAICARGVELVTEIWRLYAALEIELRQFKQATKVFESAVSCPVAGTSKDLWLQYAAFCIERKKFSNARKIFVRGLQAVKEQDQDALWASFHAFVVAHIEATMSLSTLKAQVLLPENGAATSAASTPTGASAAAAATAVPQSKAVQAAVVPQAETPVQQAPAPSVQPQQDTAQVAADVVQSPANGVAAMEPAKTSPTKTTSSGEPTIAIDPALAFVDKTGKTEPPIPIPMPVEEDSSSSKKRGMDSQLGADHSKRLKQDEASDQQPQKTQQTLEIADTLYFRHIPTVLPLIPECPHLLFDAVREGETQMEVGEELLERLSDVLRDSAVFQGVKDLNDNQRQRDRETLYRWQDLVGMQMKEGSELFARHIDNELKHATDPRELITLKAQHLGQRREFITRCQMSQQQFIEITGMDRMNALKAQQISLENMKIPEMTVTTDPKVIGMQRAILFLILEAEKIWREEMKKIAARSAKDTSAESAGSAGPAHASRGPAYYPHKPQDGSSYSNRGGFRGGRGGGYGGRGGGGGGGVDRHSNYPRANASYGNRGGPSKRDYDAHPQSMHSTGATPHGHHHAPRQQLQVRPAYQGQPQQYHSQPQQQQHRPTQSYGGGDRSVTLTQDYSNFPPQQDMNRNGGGGRFVGQSMNGAPVGGGGSGAPPAWQQQQPRHNPNQSRGNDYSHQSSRYGSGSSGGGQLALPSQAAVSSYSNGPKQNRGRPYGSAGSNNMAPPQQQQQQYGGYGKFSGAPQQQRGGDGGGGGAPAYQQSAPHNNFQSRDYAAAPQGNSSYSNRNQTPYHQQQQQAPPHHQHQQAAPFQQRGGRGGRGGYGQQHHHHQQEHDQPQMNTYHQQGQGYGRGGGGGFRRGGGGGGRYGRR